MTTAKEVIKEARINVSVADILDIRAHGSKGSKNITDQITLERINWFEECHVLNLSKVGEKKLDGLEQLLILVNPPYELILDINDRPGDDGTLRSV